MTKPLTPFRVHFADNTHIDLDAETPTDAAKRAKDSRGGIITKVKVLKEARP